MNKGTRITLYILSSITGIIVFLFLGIIIGNYIIMPIVTRQGETVEVPSVIGMQIRKAEERLKELSLKPIVYEELPDPKNPKGTVIAQKPKPGTVVKKGRNIFLTISKGKERIRVPYLLGLRIEQAQKIAEKRGFRIARIDSVQIDTIEEGRVVAMKPKPEIYVPPNTPLILSVSVSDTTATIIMPLLEGLDIEKAKKILEKDSLVIGSIKEIEIEGQGGIVIIQTPKAGAKIKKGDTVHLIVGKEP